MDEGEGKGKVEGEGAEQLSEKPTPVVSVTTPLMSPEFSPLVQLYAKKMGLGEDQTAAAIQLTQLLANIGLNPYEDPEGVMELVNSLQSLPQTPSVVRMTDSLSAGIASKLGERYLGGAPKSEVAMMVEAMRPFMTMAGAIKLAGTFFGGEGNANPKLEERIERLEKQSEIDRAVTPLKEDLKEVKEALKAGKPEEGALSRLYETLDNALARTEKMQEERMASAQKRMEEISKTDPIKIVSDAIESIRKITGPPGQRTQIDIELAKVNKEVQQIGMEQRRQLEKDRKDFQIQLEEIRDSRARLREMGQTIREGITEIGSPIAQAFAGGIQEGRRKRQEGPAIRKLSEEQLAELRQKAEAQRKIFEEAERKIDEERARRQSREKPEAEAE